MDISQQKFFLKTSSNVYENPRWFFVVASVTNNQQVFFNGLWVGVPSPYYSIS